jgi:hypothetical protein
MTAPASPSPYAPIPLTKGPVMFGIRIRRRRTTAAASEKSSTYDGPSGTPAARHACSAVLDGMPQLDSPLITELIALQAHTRNLGWLSAREPRRDEYQHLARLVLQHVLQGWHAQTGGRGRLEDLVAHPEPIGAVRGSCKDDPDQTTSYRG